MSASRLFNPILPGFYPDPSVIRLGLDYYLVTSSFEYSPGIPVFHSRDLIHWTPLGHALTRDSQLNLDKAGVSDGIFASTIRHHAGRFYLISSNRCAGTGNHFYVWSESADGPWSDPVWIKGTNGKPLPGLDPSLFFDKDGQVYFSCVAWDALGQGIGQARIDLESGQLMEGLEIIWRGTGGSFPEGPHTYRIFDSYYLLIAEGGTEYGHKVTLARSKHIDGPYTPCPDNPVLTQACYRGQDSPLQGVGHGELLEDAEGRWWFVCHAFRPSIGKLHHLGRETVLAKVEWTKDKWPLMGEKGVLPLEIPRLGVTASAPPRQPDSFIECFGNARLDPKWTFLRNPSPENYMLTDGCLTLFGTNQDLQGLGSPTWLGFRQTEFDMSLEADVIFDPLEGEEGGLTVFQTPEHHYDILIRREDGRLTVRLQKTVGDLVVLSEPRVIKGTAFTLKAVSDRRRYEFSVIQGGESLPLGSGRTQLLSTEAMQYQNFTGSFLALYTVMKGQSRPSGMKVLQVRYVSKQEPAAESGEK